MNYTALKQFPLLSVNQQARENIHNIALQQLAIDSFISVLERRGTPPVNPTEEDRYIITTGTGDWSGHDNEIVRWWGEIWNFEDSFNGLNAWVVNEEKIYYWNSSTWQEVSTATIGEIVLTGSAKTTDSTIVTLMFYTMPVLTTYEVVVKVVMVKANSVISNWIIFTTPYRLQAGTGIQWTVYERQFEADGVTCTVDVNGNDFRVRIQNTDGGSPIGKWKGVATLLQVVQELS